MPRMKGHPGASEVPRVRRAEVRRRIIESAGRLFMEQGLQATSLSAVAETAGFSKGAVYSNFANKDELCFELLSSGIDRRVESVRKAIPEKARTSRKGQLAGDRLLRIVKSEPGWQTFFVELWLRCVRSPTLRSRFAEKRRLMRGQVAELLKTEAEAAGNRLPVAAEHLASFVLALSNGLGMERLIDEKAVPADLMGKLMSWTFTGMAVQEGSDTEPQRG